MSPEQKWRDNLPMNLKELAESNNNGLRVSVEGTYMDHVARERTRYLLAYEEWENSLSPSQRKLLASAAAPDLEDYEFGSRRESLGTTGDAAERSAASYSINIAEALDGPASLLAEVEGISEEQAKIIFEIGRAHG